MWGSFGEIVFKSGFSPKSLKESVDYSYKAHKLVGQDVLYDFTGKGEESLEITITLNRAFVNVEEAINTLEEYAREGLPQRLVIGKRHLGKYVIRKMEKVYEEILPNGEIFTVQLTLKLSEVPKSEV